MAITHKKNDELEKMMAGFASLPHFNAPLDVSTDGKLVTNNNPIILLNQINPNVLVRCLHSFFNL
ncbi:SPJ_0845 family protein [Streptococcus dysgalactiae]|uniref:SPJ_0845 family protein n=1 Tax=Streptococcus dysgalactiae TaxID=1334 RepID=UPI003D729D86